MPIATLPRRMTEAGRIRSGRLESYQRDGETRTRPTRTETWRLTTRSQDLAAAAAGALGGRVQPWTSQAGPALEVVTETDRLEVVLPPEGAFDQSYELWTGAGCARRCDGRVQTTLTECACPPDPAMRRSEAAKGRACRPLTKLSVMLLALPGLGTWRMVTGSFYAAVEMPGAAALLIAASRAGQPIPALLRLDRRERRTPGQPAAPYTVPVLDAAMQPAAILAAQGAPLRLGSGGGRPNDQPPEMGTVTVIEPDAVDRDDPRFVEVAGRLFPGIVNVHALNEAAVDRIASEMARPIGPTPTERI